MLQRCDHSSVQALKGDIRSLRDRMEREPQAVHLVEIAEQILDSIR
jgi:hypothetical protein